MGEFELEEVYSKISMLHPNLPTHYRPKVRQVLGMNPDLFEKISPGRYRLKDTTVRSQEKKS